MGLGQIISNWVDRFNREKNNDVRVYYNKSKKQAQAARTGYSQTFYTHSFNGEKNLGEIGPVKNYALDYYVLRMRSWQSYLESEITQTVIKRFNRWVIGSGLKLQAEPSKVVLKYEKITIDQSFNEAIEARFNLFSRSKGADYSGMRSFNKIAKRAEMEAIVGGDVLVILRVIKGNLKVQLIDGCHVVSPNGGNEYFPEILANGNCIKYGIELSPTGEHVAFHVRQSDHSIKRIPAKGENAGMTMAFMYYGLEYRLDGVRGMPLIAVVLETMSKMNRYKEAAVGSAEERQKIAYFFEHGVHSTGESPLFKQAARASGFGSSGDELPIDEAGNQFADRVTATTNKQAFNMPVGSTVKALESKNEMFFKDFYTVNIDIVCAAIGIPPNVAMSKYDSNFSASRAALKDWEHTLNVERADVTEQFYQPIYNLFLDLEILKNKVPAPGYLNARMKEDETVLEAYRCCRFVGPPVPHIDTEKEVRAERLKLGTTGASIPLTTVEAATERLNAGESDENMEQYAEEVKAAKKLGIYQETPTGKETE
jgi:capsid protein